MRDCSMNACDAKRILKLSIRVKLNFNSAFLQLHEGGVWSDERFLILGSFIELN